MDLHYEVELALIMGKRVKDLEPEDEKGALDAIESASSPSYSPIGQTKHFKLESWILEVLAS